MYFFGYLKYQLFHLWWKFEPKKIINLNFNLINSNPQKIWNLTQISSRKDITWEIINNNLDKPWDWKELSKRSDLTWEIIINNIDKL